MSESPTAIPQGSWVLVTGANGYSGSHVVMELLKQGFNVRGTVRNLEYSQWLLNHPSVKPFVDQGRVELVLADTSKPDDFDEAVKGVAAVIHLAIVSDISPDPDTAIPATVEAALTVCRAAAKAPSVKRFVFSSTFWAAVMPVPGDSSTITNLETWNEGMVEAARAPPPYEWSLYYTHVFDVATIYVAATIDPDVKGSRIQALAGSLNWNDCLAIMRTAYPTVEFPEDFVPGNPTLTYKIEQDIALGLLQKWGGRDWISPERSITEIIDFCKQQGTLD
ncbi:hypothetical protein Neosp_011950 [[Neocosmospora] mangrovei]